MDLQPYFKVLSGPARTRKKIQAVGFLAPLTKDPKVMDALCDAAISTTDHHLRTVLIDALKENSSGANLRFSDTALHSDDPVQRKWALVNLSLMGCGEANEVVISGLKDLDASVRKAAAMSTGLYRDEAVINAFERYFEKNRFGLTVSFVSEGVRELKEKFCPIKSEEVISKRSIDTRPSEFRMNSG